MGPGARIDHCSGHDLMKKYRYGSQGRGKRVLAAMASSTPVLARIAARWPKYGLFGEDRASNLIGTWCVEHFRRYGEAPGMALEARWEHWREEGDKDLAKSIQALLEVASEAQDEGLPSTEVLVDMAGEHFESISMRAAVDAAQAELNRGNVSQARDLIDNRPKVDLGSSSTWDPAADIEDWVAAFSEELSKDLVTYPGMLGNFFKGEFVRESFVAFMASSSRGKSWWLLDIAMRAVRARHRVAYFEAGDLSRMQLIRRFGQRILRRPKRKMRVQWPTFFDGSIEGLVTEERLLPAPDPHQANRIWKKISQARKSAIKVHDSPNSTLSMTGIRGLLQEWSQQGWVPDVVVIDYADILAPPHGVRELRDQINENWKAMRALSQQYHCLVVTATQADAGSYSAQLLRRKNFSNDRRQFDHVTGYFALNMSEEEKALGLSRLNWLKRRDEAYTETQQLAVAGCLACGCPAVLAGIPPRKVDVEEQE